MSKLKQQEVAAKKILKDSEKYKNKAITLSESASGKSYSFKGLPKPDAVTEDGSLIDFKTHPTLQGVMSERKPAPIYRTKYVNGKLEIVTKTYK